MIKHVVLMKFKAEASDAKKQAVADGLRGLPAIIPEIKQYEVGFDIVHSERSCDLALVSAFDDMAAMGRYQKHPRHQAVLTLIKEICEQLYAVDFKV